MKPEIPMVVFSFEGPGLSMGGWKKPKLLASDKFTGDEIRSLSLGTVLRGFTIQQEGEGRELCFIKMAMESK